MIHLIDTIRSGDKVTHVVLGVKFVVGDASVQFKFVAVGCVQVCFDALEVARWILGIGVGGLVVLNDEGEVSERPQLEFIAIHPEVALHAIVFAALARLENSEELADALACLGNVLLYYLNALDREGQQGLLDYAPHDLRGLRAVVCSKLGA